MYQELPNLQHAIFTHIFHVSVPIRRHMLKSLANATRPQYLSQLRNQVTPEGRIIPWRTIGTSVPIFRNPDAWGKLLQKCMKKVHCLRMNSTVDKSIPSKTNVDLHAKNGVYVEKLKRSFLIYWITAREKVQPIHGRK